MNGSLKMTVSLVQLKRNSQFNPATEIEHLRVVTEDVVIAGTAIGGEPSIYLYHFG